MSKKETLLKLSNELETITKYVIKATFSSNEIEELEQLTDEASILFEELEKKLNELY
jgi:hypothetical protein